MARATGSAIFGGIRGKLGNVVVTSTSDGLVLRARVTPRNPRTPAQVAARQRQSRVSRAWSALTPDQVQAWRTFAARQGVRPMNAFSALGSRVLLVNPNGAIPPLPPSAPFLGDAPVLSAAPATGGILVSASVANGPGIVTELLIQRLPSAGSRAYRQRYRHALVATFTGASPSALLNLSPGVYTVAYRFIRAATGQFTELAELAACVVH